MLKIMVLVGLTTLGMASIAWGATMDPAASDPRVLQLRQQHNDSLMDVSHISNTVTSQKTSVTSSETASRTSSSSIGMNRNMTPASSSLSRTLEERQKLRHATVGVAADVLSSVFGVSNYRPAPNTMAAQQANSYRDRDFFDHGVLARVQKGGKWGVVDTTGKVTLEPTYKELRPAVHGYFATDDGKKGIRILNRYGKEERIPFTQEELDSTAAEKEKVLLAFREKNRYGFKNYKGEVIIPATFKEIIVDFSENRAFVKNEKGKKVAIDSTGKELFEAPYDILGPYSNGLAEYQRKVSGFNAFGFLGFVASGIFSNVFDSAVGGGFTYDGIKRGYIDRDGKIIIDSKMDQVYPMTPYGTAVKNKGKVAFLNRAGEPVIPYGDYEVGSIDEINGLLSLKDKATKKYGVFNVTDGSQVVPFGYDRVEFLGSNRMTMTKDKKTYLVDMKTGNSIKVFDESTKFGPFTTDDFAWIKSNDTYSVIDLQGEMTYKGHEGLIDEVGLFHNGYSPVKVSGKWGIMDTQGKFILDFKYDRVDIL